MMTVVIESDHVIYVSALNMRPHWLFLVLSVSNRWFTAVCRRRPTRKPCCGRETACTTPL